MTTGTGAADGRRHEPGTIQYDDTSPYAVPVHDRRNPAHRVIIHVDAIDAECARMRAVGYAKCAPYRMRTPAADEPRRVTLSWDEADVGPGACQPTTCRVRGCANIPESHDTQGYCGACFTARRAALMCATPGCGAAIGGRGAGYCRACTSRRQAQGMRRAQEVPA